MRFLLSPRTRWAAALAARKLGFEVLDDRTVPGFLAPVSYGVGSGPVAVASGDFNGDGALDLVAANQDSSTLGMLLGRGNSYFQPPQSLPLGAGWNPDSVAVADLDGDGALDLVAGTQFRTLGGSGGYYSGVATIAPTVVLGNGDGTFQPARRVATVDSVGLYYYPFFSVTSVPSAVAVGDIDRDGTPDLVVTSGGFTSDSDFGEITESDRVTVLLGRGDGTFTPTPQTGVNGFLLPLGGVEVAVGDVNNDGTPDVATSAGELLLGTGDGTFGVTQTGLVGSDVALADLDGDRRPDVVTAGGSRGYIGSDNAVAVAPGNGDGTIRPVVRVATGPNPLAVAVGDFDRDGTLDLVTANQGGNCVSALLGRGDGTFQPLAPSAAGSDPVALAVGDFDGDGLPDAAAANGSAGTASVLINDGNWAPQGPPSIMISDVTMREGNTGTTLFAFTVSLSAASGVPVTVNYATADGTASTADGDYDTLSGTLDFAPGETTKTVVIAVRTDTKVEPDETFFVNLTGAVNASNQDGQGIGTIVSDDHRHGRKR